MYLLLATAIGEGGIGLLLLIWPPLPLVLLLGVEQVSPEALVTARIAGAALLAIGVACWLARNDAAGHSQRGLLLSVLIYDVGAAGVLAYAGWFLHLAGVALWPGVVLHAALAVWCGASLWVRRPSPTPEETGKRKALPGFPD
jgi:hypothetical protein